nr:hypothetical protein [Candidatus Sigynarchaeota archaeon]
MTKAHHAFSIAALVGLAATVATAALASISTVNAEFFAAPMTSQAPAQNYTSATFSDPVIASINQTAATALLQGIMHDTISGTGSTLDGAFKIPNSAAASIAVTHDVIDAYLLLDGSVPGASNISAWIWSRWDAVAGTFTDEYSVNWTALVDKDACLAGNRYSPLVSTAIALDALRLLRQPVLQAVNDSIRTYILSCYDSAAGTIKGVPGTCEPTLLDVYWGVKALSLMGELHHVDAAKIATFISSLLDTNGLFKGHAPVLVMPAPEYMSSTISLTRLAVEILSIIGQVGSIDTTALRNAIMTFYSTTGHYFTHNGGTASKTTLATGDALAIFSVIGYPTGFEATEVPQIIDRYSRVQISTGGWAVEDGDAVTPTGHCAQVIAMLSRFVGRDHLGTININNLKGLFLASALSSPGLMAYAPYPSYQPSLDACREAVDIAIAGHLLDATAEAAARAMVDATNTGSPYPLARHDQHTMSYGDGSAFRTLTLSSVVYLEHRVALKDALAMPFTMVDLNDILTQLQGMQLKEAVAGIQGLCLATPTYKAWLATMGGLVPRAASLESTLATVKAIRTLSTYGSGSMFVIDILLDLPLLYARLAPAYRESSVIAWWEREYPASFQLPAGFDNAKLRDTRLALEILNTTGGFTHPTISAVVSIPKLTGLALTESRRTVTDIDNALTILSILNQTIPQATIISIIGELTRFRVAGSAWFTRLGLPNFGETMKAYRILSRFKGLCVNLDHVIETESGILAISGTDITLRAELVNSFYGTEPSWTYTYAASPAGINYTAGAVPVTITMPLSENMLGPGNISVSMPAASLCPAMTIPMTIGGVLAIEPSGNPITFITARREPVVATLQLVIVNPDNETEQADVRAGTIVARGMSINHTGYFVLDNSTSGGRYMTLLGVNPLEENTTYRVEASRAYCELLQAMLVVRCTDNLSWSPAFVAPLSCGSILAVLAISKTNKLHRQRSK